MGKNNIHETEIPETTLGGFEPVSAFTFRSIVQSSNTDPVTAAAETIANLCNLYDTLIVINTVASPDSKDIY